VTRLVRRSTSIRPMTGPTLRLLGVSLALAVFGAAGEAYTATPPTLLCQPPPGQDLLPPAARHGVIEHMPQYAAVRLASARQRARARTILHQLVTAATHGNWKSPAAAELAGYDTRTSPRKPGDRSAHFFHAERHEEARRGSIFNASRPKALIYANVPGHPLILVGAMWSTRDGELGPTPAGPILRWHSHIVCKSGKKRGLKPPASGVCPEGSQLRQGASEMLHVWFTDELRSAFAIRAPQPELCGVGLLPPDYCRRR
jgi:hypothetical protein